MNKDVQRRSDMMHRLRQLYYQELGRIAYATYRDNIFSSDMAVWVDLPDNLKHAWTAVGKALYDAVEIPITPSR